MDVSQIFFDGWAPIFRTAVVGVLAYVVLIAFLRISGKRTLAKMNAFDLVVTVSLGSTLASILISKDVSLAQGTTALALLIGLQFLITWTSVRSKWTRKLVTGEPALLLHRGTPIPANLRDARVTESELTATVRSAGLASLEEAQAVILETDGSFSVIRTGEGDSALAGVKVPSSKA